MSYEHYTPEDLDLVDQTTEYLSKNWGWYLASGVVSILFGAIILSFRIETAYALAICFSLYLLLIGVFQIAGAVRGAHDRWMYIVGGGVSLVAAVLTLIWPEITLFILAIFIGWMLLIWGVIDVVTSLMHTHAPYWWLYLVRGLISAALGVWALADPRGTIVVLVSIIGLFSLLFGVIEVIGAFTMKSAHANWLKARARLTA